MLKIILSALIAFSTTTLFANTQIEPSMQADIEKGNRDLIHSSSKDATLNELKSILKDVDQILANKNTDRLNIRQALNYSNNQQKNLLLSNLKALNQSISTLQEIRFELVKTIQIIEKNK